MDGFKYIHIALRGEVQGATRTIYTFSPTKGEGEEPRWDAGMVEPAAAIKRFLNATECYVLQESPLGHYISLITRNAVPERGYIMISLLISDGCSLSGRQVYSVFSGLKRIFSDEETVTDDTVEAVLLSSSVPREPVKLEAWRYREPEGEVHKEEAAYRTYISVQELESIFSFPAQPEYENYRCLLVVSATTSLRPGVKMPRITVPIRKQYGVVCPEGVMVSSNLVYDGDRLVLTYCKEGFDSHTETVVVGNPAAYTKYEGCTIQVRTAAQTGIRFIRRIPIKVQSVKGTPLNGYTIAVNERSVSTMEPYIDFTERDLTPGEDVMIQVASNNYLPLKLTKPTSEMLTTDELVLQLQPVEQGVTLRLDFGDGRVFEQKISIEKNTPEYNRLHSGNFHGFRAHRQVTSDHSEVYNVDVRLVNPPVAPNFETSPEVENTNKAPKFVNVSDDAADERPYVDSSRPERADEDAVNVVTDDAAANGDAEARDAVSRNRKLYTWLGVGVAAVIAVVVVTLFMPEGDKYEVTPAAETVLTEETASTAPQAAEPMTPEEAADAEYLNGNAAWVLSKLTSPMGQSLAAAITEGDLDALANNDYFKVPGRCKNNDALKIVDMAWAAIGSPNERGNARKLRQSVTDDSVVLHELVNSLARVRPSENVNTRPRPGVVN